MSHWPYEQKIHNKDHRHKYLCEYFTKKKIEATTGSNLINFFTLEWNKNAVNECLFYFYAFSFSDDEDKANV